MHQITAGKASSAIRKALFSVKRIAVAISETSGEYHDKVDQGPNAATAEREQLGDAYAGLPGVKAMHAYDAEEPAQEQGDQPVVPAFRNTCRCCRLLGHVGGGHAAFHAYNGLVIYRGTAVGAKHTK